MAIPNKALQPTAQPLRDSKLAREPGVSLLSGHHSKITRNDDVMVRENDFLA